MGTNERGTVGTRLHGFPSATAAKGWSVGRAGGMRIAASPKVAMEHRMNRPPNNRILMLLENMTFPQDLRVRREANALYAAGYRVTVICPAGDNQPYRETVNGLSVYRYPAPRAAIGFLGYIWEYGWSMAASFFLTALVFLTEGFDVIHAHNPPDTFVFIAMLYKLFGKRFVYDHHDLSAEMYQARLSGRGNRVVYRVLIWLEKLTCRFADHVIVTNESYKKFAMERGRVPEIRITIVRDGIDLTSLNWTSEPDRGLRGMGKTIVAFDLTEHRFAAQEAAVYVPANDESAFARAIAQLMDDPQRRVALGEVGPRRIKSQLAWEYSIPNLLRAYRLVLPRAAPIEEQVSQQPISTVQPQHSSLAQAPSYKSGNWAD